MLLIIEPPTRKHHFVFTCQKDRSLHCATKSLQRPGLNIGSNLSALIVLKGKASVRNMWNVSVHQSHECFQGTMTPPQFEVAMNVGFLNCEIYMLLSYQMSEH